MPEIVNYHPHNLSLDSSVEEIKEAIVKTETEIRTFLDKEDIIMSLSELLYILDLSVRRDELMIEIEEEKNGKNLVKIGMDYYTNYIFGIIKRKFSQEYAISVFTESNKSHSINKMIN